MARCAPRASAVAALQLEGPPATSSSRRPSRRALPPHSRPNRREMASPPPRPRIPSSLVTASARDPSAPSPAPPCLLARGRLLEIQLRNLPLEIQQRHPPAAISRRTLLPHSPPTAPAFLYGRAAADSDLVGNRCVWAPVCECGVQVVGCEGER